MARGGNADPDYRLEEDMIIAGTVAYMPLHRPIIINKVSNFLKSRFPEGHVDEFVGHLPNVLGLYFCTALQGGNQREALKSKMSKIGRAIDAFLDAWGDIDQLEYEILQKATAKFETPKDRTRLDVYPSEFHQRDLLDVLGSVFLGVAFLEGRLNGTAQDSKRPLRVFISTLLFRWSQCGFPLPMWISGADANDPGSKDQDNFCELVHLILDDMEVPTPEGQVQPRLTTGQIDAVLRALLAKKNTKKIPAKCPNSRL
jgi:hypothetical protein